MYVHTTSIVGAHFRGGTAKTICGMLRQKDEIELEREPDNRFDQNAVKAVVNGEHIGYVSAKDGTAAAIAPFMDEGDHTVRCFVVGHHKIDQPAVVITVASPDDTDEDVQTAVDDVIESFEFAQDGAA